MAEPQLSVRSAKAREIAHRLARRERRSIADIVERALEAYEVREAGRESASSFYSRMATYAKAAGEEGNDGDLKHLIDENRKPHTGIDL
jgi:hypothetical protein